MYFFTYCYFVWLVLHRRLNHCINYIRLVVEEKLQNMIAIYSILWFSHKLRFVCSIISPVLYRYRHFCICLSPEALHRKLLKTRLTASIKCPWLSLARNRKNARYEKKWITIKYTVKKVNINCIHVYDF